MKRKIPERFIGHTQIHRNFGGVEVTYEVDFTIYGEVIKLDTPVLQLPEAAQKLIFGKDYFSVRKRATAESEMIPFYFPMACLHLYRDRKDKQFDKALTNLQLAQKDLDKVHPLRYINDPWVRLLYKNFLKESQDPHIAALAQLTDDNRSERYIGYQALRNNTGELAGPFLYCRLRSMPDYYEKEIRHCLRALEFYPNPKFYDYFVKMLGKDTYAHFHPFYLAALCNHQHPELSSFLCDYWQHNPSLNSFGQNKIIAATKKMDMAEVKDLLIGFLRGTHFKVAITAYNELRNRKISAHQCANLVYDHLQQSEDIDVITTNLKLLNHISLSYPDAKFPSFQELFRFTRLIINHRQGYQSVLGMVVYLKKEFQPGMGGPLIEYLAKTGDDGKIQLIKIMRELGSTEFAEPIAFNLLHYRMQVQYEAIIAIRALLETQDAPKVYKYLIEFIASQPKRGYKEGMKLLLSQINNKKFPEANIWDLVETNGRETYYQKIKKAAEKIDNFPRLFGTYYRQERAEPIGKLDELLENSSIYIKESTNLIYRILEKYTLEEVELFIDNISANDLDS